MVDDLQPQCCFNVVISAIEFARGVTEDRLKLCPVYDCASGKFKKETTY